MSQESRSSDELGNPKLFDGLTAWFSDSIADRRKDLWVQNDGAEEEWDQARYVFSDDASAADTVRIFDSEAYLNEHLAVFHSSYIDECLRHGDMKMVALGKFILPPADIHRGLPTKLYWEMLVEREKKRQNQQTTARKQTPVKRANTQQSTSSSSSQQKQQRQQQGQQQQRMEKRQTPSASNTTAMPESSTRSEPQKSSRQTPQLSKASQRSSPRKKLLQESSSSKKRQPVNVEPDAAAASLPKHQSQSRTTRSTQKHNSPAKSPVFSKKRRKTSQIEDLSDAASNLHDIEPLPVQAPETEQFTDYQWVNTLEQEDGDIEEFVIGQHGCNVKTLSAVTTVS